MRSAVNQSQERNGTRKKAGGRNPTRKNGENGAAGPNDWRGGGHHPPQYRPTAAQSTSPTRTASRRGWPRWAEDFAGARGAQEKSTAAVRPHEAQAREVGGQAAAVTVPSEGAVTTRPSKNRRPGITTMLTATMDKATNTRATASWNAAC